MDVLIWLEPNIRMESKIERELSRKNLMKILIFLEGGARQNIPIIPKRKMPFCGNDFPALYHQDLLVQQNSTSFNFSPLWMLTFPLFSWVQQSHLHPAWPRPSQFPQPTCSWKRGGEPVFNLDQTRWDNIALLRLFVYPFHGSSVPLRRVLVAHVLFKRGGVGATHWGLILWKFCKYIDLPKRKNITLLTVTQPR